MLGTNHVLRQGRYRIINAFDQNAAGGMYEAYDTVSDTKVMLSESVGVVGKVVTQKQLEAMNAAFAGEAKVLSEIKHDSLVSVQDYFSEIDRQYLVLEAVTGSNLTKYLDADESKPALTDILSWVDQVLGALHYLHALTPPVIHRDIRPENIKLTSNLKVKLLTAKISGFGDSGDPKPSDHAGDNAAMNYRPLEQIWPDLDGTSQRVILNSYDEKAAGILLRPLDARSDIYSTAASFYHILTGTLPDDALERTIAILDGKPDTLVRPTEIDGSIPPEISDALMRAMAIRRENRFDSAVIMAQVLKTALVRAREREGGLLEIPIEKPAAVIQVEPKQADKAPQVEQASIEAQIEHEQRLADERQREIEAEQARLDEERDRLDQRRLELEAERERQAADRERLKLEAEQARARAEEERKRLEKEKLEQEAEKERQRMAERLAALEAEREHEHAEEERLAKEAEAERLRAEQRLQELEAERERHRAEQVRLALEAKEEQQRTQRRISELSGANLDISEPVEEKPEVSEPAVQLRQGAPRFSALTDDGVYAPDLGQHHGVNWRVAAIGAVVVLLAGAAVIWMVVPANGPAPSAVLQQQPALIEERPTPQPATQPEQQLSEQASEIPAETGEEVPAVQGQRQPAAGRDRQRRPVAGKAPGEKKKITVDDLINDN